ncbi:MAG: 3-isopropylmalate dehydrogenase [Candidatus Korobacteraceae bacterium]|jgi:3-isopropylmalate dehydrogenase
MKLRIAVLPGDGVGPEVTREAVRVLRTVSDVNGYDFQFREYPVGGAAVVAEGHPLPQSTLDACLASNAVLLGAVGGPQFDSLPVVLRPEAGLLKLRKALGAFANLRPAIAYEAVAHCSPLRPEVLRGTNILFVRELLGGLYFGEPRGRDANGAYDTMRYSVAEVERIARIAFEQARLRRRHVISVDKANVLECSRLWRQTVSDLAGEYPDVKLEHTYVDSFAMQLIATPSRYDVVVTENLFGDVLSDESAVLSGSLGMLGSASIGGAVGLYEPVHGSAPDIAGKNMANPIGAIASAAMLLRFTAGLHRDADDVETAIARSLHKGIVTADLRPDVKPATTREAGDEIERTLADLLGQRQTYHAV